MSEKDKDLDFFEILFYIFTLSYLAMLPLMTILLVLKMLFGF